MKWVPPTMTSGTLEELEAGVPEGAGTPSVEEELDVSVPSVAESVGAGASLEPASVGATPSDEEISSVGSAGSSPSVGSALSVQVGVAESESVGVGSEPASVPVTVRLSSAELLLSPSVGGTAAPSVGAGGASVGSLSSPVRVVVMNAPDSVGFGERMTVIVSVSVASGALSVWVQVALGSCCESVSVPVGVGTASVGTSVALDESVVGAALSLDESVGAGVAGAVAVFAGASVTPKSALTVSAPRSACASVKSMHWTRTPLSDEGTARQVVFPVQGVTSQLPSGEHLARFDEMQAIWFAGGVCQFIVRKYWLASLERRGGLLGGTTRQMPRSPDEKKT